MTTRERIIQTAIQLFNQHGYYTSTLSNIALATSMSRGNLAYHFKDKTAILDDISITLTSDIEEIQKDRKAYPAFSNLGLDMKMYAILQKRYAFIFRDTSVLEHKAISQVMSDWARNSIQRNIEAFAFAVEVGNMKKETYKGLYQQLAVNAWMISYYWTSQKAVRKIKDLEAAERMVWSTIVPHFTEKGIQTFKSYYGPNYLNQLGHPINTLISDTHFF